MASATLLRVRKFVEARLSPEGELGLHLTVGLLLMLMSVWLFANIADEVVEAEELVALDARISHWFMVNAVPGLTRFLLVLTHLHSGIAMFFFGSLLGLYFHRKKAKYWLLTLLIALPGGALLNVLLKYTFTRARPVFDEPILTLTTYSFPSGHTAAATVFYGLIAAYLVCLNRRWLHRAGIALGATLMVVLVGFSRVYLGAHFFSDVLAAAVESAGWLAVCITAISTLRRRRAGRADE